MTVDQYNSLVSAVEAAEVKNYTLVTDIPTYLRHIDGVSILKLSGEMVVNFRRPQFSATNQVNGVEIVVADLSDVHEARVLCNAEEAKTIAENFGTAFDDEEFKLIMQIDKKNVPIIPVTGDYNGFKYITGKAYELLTEEQKEEYEAAKEAYEKEKEEYLPKNAAAVINA